MASPTDMNVNSDDGIIRRKVPLKTDDVDFNKAPALPSGHFPYSLLLLLCSLVRGSESVVVPNADSEKPSINTVALLQEIHHALNESSSNKQLTLDKFREKIQKTVNSDYSPEDYQKTVNFDYSPEDYQKTVNSDYSPEDYQKTVNSDYSPEDYQKTVNSDYSPEDYQKTVNSDYSPEDYQKTVNLDYPPEDYQKRQ
uniref:Uncharacterized protein n=1 Tax=Timema douglasi TaxID=61478 RepID=A0A7R8ZDY8_TIMDO|nr:unnamed protein product [Timema douglasi]